MSLLTYIQDHMNDDIHTAVVYEGRPFFIGDGFKQCGKCWNTLPRNHFVGDKNRPDGKYLYCKDCRKVYHLANRAHIVAKQRRYNDVHRDKVKESHKEYASKRFFYIRANNLRVRQKDATATYQAIARLWKKQRGCCAVTGRILTKENSQLDHIVPIVRGGKADIENLRWVHRDVNYAKRDLSDAAFFQLCCEVADRHPVKTEIKEG